jgi:hypothetical protein
LGPGGRSLWDAIADSHDLDAAQLVTLAEACRAKDRLDKLDELLRGDVDTWAHLTHRLQTEDYELKIDAALTQANATANLMKQLLAALRLPDQATGKRPQQRGGARGAYASTAKSGRVTAIEAARQRAQGA